MMRRKLKLYCLRIKSVFMSLFLSRKTQKNVAILVCKKWQNKVSDDILLKNDLLRNHINAKLVAWDKEHDYSKYDLVVIRSIWGYEKNIAKFESFLAKLKKEKVHIVNSINILKDNYNKERQFALLDKYKIPHIKTTFIKEKCSDIEKFINDKIKEKEFVIKPTISGSGNNTCLVTTNKKRNNRIKVENINAKYQSINETTSLMVQPFIKEVDNGEISLIYINGAFSHGIVRYPKIFNSKHKTHFIDNSKIDKEAFALADKVLEIKEYQNNLYERIDMIKVDNEYVVMEVELVEPDLFIRLIPEELLKEYIVHKLVLAIKDNLQ